MAKKTRKRAAAKAAKKSKALSKTKRAKKRPAVAKSRRKIAARKESTPVAQKKPAAKKIQKSFIKKIEDKVAGAFAAVVDTLTSAEQLHHQLDPGISNEPE